MAASLKKALVDGSVYSAIGSPIVPRSRRPRTACACCAFAGVRHAFGIADAKDHLKRVGDVMNSETRTLRTTRSRSPTGPSWRSTSKGGSLRWPRCDSSALYGFIEDGVDLAGVSSFPLLKHRNLTSDPVRGHTLPLRTKAPARPSPRLQRRTSIERCCTLNPC
jgi:hypothetical protein